MEFAVANEGVSRGLDFSGHAAYNPGNILWAQFILDKMITSQKAPSQKLESVQMLRAIAALMVVTGHSLTRTTEFAESHGGTFWHPSFPGGSGVDIFFLISGFVMVYASESLFAKATAALTFMSRRIVRIVPLYWAVTIGYIALLAVAARHIEHAFPSLMAILQSLFFIPSMAFKSLDNYPFPVLAQGWTLNYEMFFYVVFAAFLFLKREFAVLCVAGTMLFCVALGLLFHPANTLLRFWSQPIILEFVFGMGIALLKRRHVSLPMWVRIAAVVAAVVWLAIDVSGFFHLRVTPNNMSRIVGWGLPATLILAATVLGKDMMPKRFEHVASKLGDASYSLYLTHPFVIDLFYHSGIVPHQAIGYWAWIVGQIIVASVAALVLNHYLEQPSINYFRSKLPAKKPMPLVTTVP
jgi:exopolysaccharide production protein ExoZ